MQTYLKISTEYSKELTDLSEKLQQLCDKIEDDGAWTLCFPKGGNLLSVIQLLSENQVQYEVQVLEKEV